MAEFEKWKNQEEKTTKSWYCETTRCQKDHAVHKILGVNTTELGHLFPKALEFQQNIEGNAHDHCSKAFVRGKHELSNGLHT